MSSICFPSSDARIVAKDGAAARLPRSHTREIFIGILYLSSPSRLEPLWLSGPYSAQAKRSGRRDPLGYGGPFSLDFRPPANGAQVQAAARTSTMDIIVIGIDVLFFALSLAYIKACDAL